MYSYNIFQNKPSEWIIYQILSKGFGSSQADSQFKSKTRKLLEEYTSSHNPYDLVFTPDFSSDERAAIHK